MLDSKQKQRHINPGWSEKAEEHVIEILKDKENVIEDKEVISDKNFKPKSCSSPKDKNKISQLLIKKDNVKKMKVKEDLLKCTKCE